MNKKSSTKTQVRLVRFKDAAHILGLPIEVLPALIRKIGCKAFGDEAGAPCISFDDFSSLHESPLIVTAVNTALRNESEQRLLDSQSGADKRFAQEIQVKLKEYRTHIDLLEEIHGSYLFRVRPIHDQTPLMAAYLIYARVINLLNMGRMCLEAGYWNAGLVLRQIDEAIQVAEYFSTCEPTPKLKRDVLKWFRENRTPQPVDIRKAISARVGLELPDHSAETLLYAMNELYEIKSKWVHPAFSPIRETLRTYPLEGTAAVTGFDYGPCSYPRKLHELTLFYRSSIWTAIQGFVLCFQRQMPLDPKDFERLHELDRRFASEPDGL